GGVPVDTSTFLTLPSATNARNRPSGDQNGCVPRGTTLWASSESSDRSHRATVPSDAAATNASALPSGDTAMNADDCVKFTSAGGATENLTARTTAEARRNDGTRSAAPAMPANNTPASPSVIRIRRARCTVAARAFAVPDDTPSTLHFSAC